MICKSLLAGQDLPHIWRMAPYFSILVAPAARDRDLYVRETVALQLLYLLLELGVMARGNVVVVLCGGAGGGVGLARGALVAIDMKVDSGDRLRGNGGAACVGYIGPTWGIGCLGGGYLYHAKIIHCGPALVVR